MATVWTGRNWQLMEPDGPLSMVGVTFGIGLLNEPVEATGTLSIALAALASELTRPVELASGETSVPEGLAELHSDTVSIAIRGSLEAVTAAWRRFPGLFTADTVADDCAPLRPEQPMWPADLLVRTGRNAATLARWQLLAPDAAVRARMLLTELDPSTGRTPAVFFTTDASLVGIGGAVREELPAPLPHWADGTPRRWRQPASDPGLESSASRAGLLPRPEETVLCSALVPRSAAGAVAADLLRAQVNSTNANARAGLTVRAAVTGVGADYCVVLFADRMPEEATRRSVLGEFSRTLRLVPGPWLELALTSATGSSSPRLERERALAGLDPVLPVTRAGLHSALAAAADTLHLALDLSAAELDSGSRLNLGGIPGHLEPLVAYWEPNFDGEQEFRTRSTDGIPSTSLVITPNSIVVPVGGPGNPFGLAVQWDGVDTSRLLARVEDPAGTITLLDESMRSVTIAPAQFPDANTVMRAVDAHLAGVVRLSFLSDVRLPTAPPPAPVGRRHRPRRGRKKSVWGGISRVLIVLVCAVGSSFLAQGVIGPAVAEDVPFGDTVTLDNETEITASGFTVQFPTADRAEYLVGATIEFCAGTDTSVSGHPPAIQRTIAPDDFALVNKDETEGRLIDNGNQLDEVTLEAGQCTTGEVLFETGTVYTPNIIYTNAVGDEVTWFE